jgi:hypothetical protein
MAKTSKAKRATRKAIEPGPQAPPGTWTPAELSAAIRRGTIEEKVALLKKAGILDENGEISKRYRDWGSKVTRTMTAITEGEGSE